MIWGGPGLWLKRVLIVVLSEEQLAALTTALLASTENRVADSSEGGHCLVARVCKGKSVCLLCRKEIECPSEYGICLTGTGVPDGFDISGEV